MTIADEYMKLKKETEFTGKNGKVIAFVGSGGEIILMDRAMYISKDDAVLFARWILKTYLDDLSFQPTGTFRLDDEPMMTEIRDKHFPKIPVEEEEEKS